MCEQDKLSKDRAGGKATVVVAVLEVLLIRSSTPAELPDWCPTLGRKETGGARNVQAFTVKT